MKFLCAGCERFLEVENFRVEGGTLVVTCSQCNAETRATPRRASAEHNLATGTDVRSSVTPLRKSIAPRPAAFSPEALITPAPPPSVSLAPAPDAPFRVPQGHCPKCISRRPEQARACASCGLVFANADGTHLTFDPSPWLKEAWLRVAMEWEQESGHEALRNDAMNRGELADLGRLYRLRLATHPNDGRALRGRDEVVRLALLPQLSLREQKAQVGAPKWKYVGLLLVIALSLVALFALVKQILAT